VSASEFFLFFINFFKIFKKIKILPRVKLTLCHTWQWQCHMSLFGRCHFFILNLVPLFYFLSQF